MSETIAYKVLRADESLALTTQGQFTGSPVDIKDGFIHLSLAGQLQATLDKHYTSGDDLTLVAVDLAACEDEVKFEVSRGGARFPHLYGILHKTAARRMWSLVAGADGRYVLPSDLPLDLPSDLET